MSGQAGQEQIDTVWKAAAYGDFEKLRELAEADPDALHRPDEQGFFALQWAALNNRVAVLTYLLDRGCDVNATDGTGQSALHWTAVRGSTPALETLLRAGADLAARDSRGYTVCHVAAQYGQTATLYHLALKWGADTDALDSDGRSPLHWAAYKGFADTLRLLLVLGCQCNLPDKEGCTPLHWAAIRGHTEACTVLLQGGGEEALSQSDSTGSTPSQLAIEKGHRLLGLHLAEYKMRQDKKRRSGGGVLAMLTKLHLSPVIWGIILGMLAMMAYSIIRNKAFPAPTGANIAAMWLTFALAFAGLYFLYLTTSADPGFIPLNRSSPAGSGSGSKSSSIQMQRWDSGSGKGQERRGGGGGGSGSAGAVLDNPALASGQWGQLCVSCRIVRPLRAKHCSVTNRCIEVFDHYCPWVGNAIGRGNRHLFLTFLWLELGAILASTLLAVVRIHDGVTAASKRGDHSLMLLGPVLFVVFDVFLLISVAALAIAQASQVARNVTTNELANWHRYKYMHGPEGDFHNPFDRGWRRNCVDTCKPTAAPASPFVLRGDETSETMALLAMEQGG
ncbi:S-acyltransferase 24 [Chlorella sorokiniana]|uniref:S-acyltransferase n=1 Tax=Chlorella sorokiniana TaxID=3076 RepID=A0A2P6TW08_CHLSO|nr:S-acyltransferase 24 [Chlorella sorokiniana]|eukprot:PRW58247.1 S-acyltransferase 24 [Chlorella sorokiniana]